MANRDLLHNGFSDAVWLNTNNYMYEGWDALASPNPFFGISGFLDVATGSFTGKFLGFDNIGSAGNLSAVFDNADAPVYQNGVDGFPGSVTVETITNHVSAETSAGLVPLFDYTSYFATDLAPNGATYQSVIGTSEAGSPYKFLPGSDKSDFNGDGQTDFLLRETATAGSAPATDYIAEMLSNGQGGYTQAYRSSNLDHNGGAWVVLGTADFNQDGTSDILWRDSANGNIEIWFMKNGLPDHYYDAPLPTSYTIDAIGDFNGDGSTDLLMHDTTGHYYTWNFVNGTLDLAHSDDLGPIGQSGWSVKDVGDFNGDGTTDILWQNLAQANAQGPLYEAWYMSNGHVASYSPDYHDPSSAKGFFPVGTNQFEGNFKGFLDPNGDGQSHAIFDSPGSTTTTTTTDNSHPFPITMTDTVTVNHVGEWSSNSASNTANTITTLFNYNSYEDNSLDNPNSGFGGNIFTSQHLLGTANGDGDSDSFNFVSNSDKADFNGDGHSDFLLLKTVSASGDYVGYPQAGTFLDEMVSDGHGGYTQGFQSSNLGSWQVHGTGDFNGDGSSDILWRNSSTGNIEIWFMKNGQVDHYYDAPLPAYYTIDAIGDFHHDGSADLLMHDTAGQYFTWNFVNGTPDFAHSDNLGAVGKSGWTVASVGDYNGNGTDDILWQNNSAGGTQGPLYEVWYMANGHPASYSSDVHEPANWHLLA
jgi:hypothetical protein